MAEFSKYGKSGVGRLFLHNNRKANDGVQHSNESIDNSKTVFNYHLKKGSVQDLQSRLEELFALKRKDMTVLGEMIVTLPADVKEEDERDFFQAVYDFYSEDFGEDNIINAVVHKDEKTPHMHLDFVPVIEMKEPPQRGTKLYDDWTNEHNGTPPAERVCCREKITKPYLNTMHQRLSAYVKEQLGYEVSILNGATANGNRTILQLKADSLKEDVEKLEKEKAHLNSEIHSILTLARDNGIDKNDVSLYPLLQKIADLEAQNETLKGIIARNGYSYKKEDLEKLKQTKYEPVKSLPVSIYEGRMCDNEIENNSVVVIELPDQIKRPLPQQKMIDEDRDLQSHVNFVSATSKQVILRQSRTGTNKIYLFIKTDSTQQTLQNLLEASRMLKELDMKNRKLYMQKIESDEYDFARAVLTKDKIESIYFTGENPAKPKNERTIEKEKT